MLKTATLTKLAEALSKLELIQEIDQLKAAVDSHRPISKEIQDRIFQKFRLDWNYNSNAIEGNKLTYGETVALLMHGVTAKGKPLKDHMDVKGHNEGINLLLDIVKSERDFTQNDIRSLHEIILVEAYSSKTITSEGIPATRKINIGQYKTVPNHVKTPTGEMHYYASPAETPALMNELMVWYEATKKNENIHPFITASLFHHRFVSIHPFDDGNGRMTRLLMNLILMRNQYPLIVVPMKLREEYYGVLSQADVNEFEPLVEYFGKLLKHSLEIQLKGIRGEDISEPDDIDKKIELFRKSFSSNEIVKEKKTNENVFEIISNSVLPLFDFFIAKCRKIDSLFFEGDEIISFKASKVSSKLLKESFRRSHDSMKKTILVPSKRKGNYKNFLDFVKEKNISTHENISLCYTWKGFKKINEPFDFNYEFTFSFKEYKYSILDNSDSGKYLIEKFYPHNLTENEINFIVKKSFDYILEKIQQKSNQ